MKKEGNSSRLEKASVVPIFNKKEVWQKKEEKLVNYGDHSP